MESLCKFKSGPSFCDFTEKREPPAIEGALDFDKTENCVVCKESFVTFVERDLILMVEIGVGGRGAFLIWNLKKKSQY
jgi:hypothetical protein